MGEPQSHNEMTRLRSTPAGRGGATVGASPALTRSEKSANACRASPKFMKKLPIDGPEGPTRVRFTHAASVDAVPAAIGGRDLRVGRLPSWWQSKHSLVSIENFFWASRPAGALTIASHQAA